jgi:hypothetical protein
MNQFVLLIKFYYLNKTLQPLFKWVIKDGKMKGVVFVSQKLNLKV